MTLRIIGDASPCPHCGDQWDDVADYNGDRSRKPADGDFGMCVECLGVYVYTFGPLGRFRRHVSPEEKARLAKDQPLLQHLQMVKRNLLEKKSRLLTYTEEQRLKLTTSEEEWGEVCDAIKAARDGAYPQEWFLKIVASGFMATQQKRWKARV